MALVLRALRHVTILVAVVLGIFMLLVSLVGAAEPEEVGLRGIQLPSDLKHHTLRI
jgi:hypothetical protein